jgi:hypothetical protein
MPENIYKIIKCNENKIKLDKIIGIESTLKISSLPMIYIINGSKIYEIPPEEVSDIESLSKLLI